MSRFWMTCLGACVCLCAMPGQARAQVARTRATTTAVKETPVRTIPQPARSDARGVFEENIRVVLLVQRPDEEPVYVSVIAAHSLVSLEALSDMAEMDGNAVPTTLRLDASIEPLGEGEYFVSYDVSTSRPVVTAKSVAKGGVQRSSFQYGKSGAKASARLKIGSAITILKDPGKEISLELQSVDE